MCFGVKKGGQRYQAHKATDHKAGVMIAQASVKKYTKRKQNIKFCSLNTQVLGSQSSSQRQKKEKGLVNNGGDKQHGATRCGKCRLSAPLHFCLTLLMDVL